MSIGVMETGRLAGLRQRSARRQFPDQGGSALHSSGCGAGAQQALQIDPLFQEKVDQAMMEDFMSEPIRKEVKTSSLNEADPRYVMLTLGIIPTGYNEPSRLLHCGGTLQVGSRGFILILGVILCQCSLTGGPVPQQGGSRTSGRCGPPKYCARTDRQTVTYAPTPPALGPAGSIITDPSFSSRILRVTDASSDPQHPDIPYHSPAGSIDNAWNTTSTRFFGGDTGGAFFIFDFDPSKMSARWQGRLNVPWRAEPQFSFTNPDILYGVTGRNLALQQYNLSSHQLSTLNDIGTCIKLGPSDSSSAFTLSGDDNRLSVVIGPQQDHNNLVYVYDRKRGCRWYNTQTGEVGGQWGPAGAVAVPYRVSIHYAAISRNGEYVDIGASQFNSSSLIWEVGTTNVTLCGHNPLDQCTGHHALGFSHLLNSANNVHPLDFVVRPYDHLRSMTHLIDNLPRPVGWYDYHVSWNYNDGQDEEPACFSTYRPTNPAEPGAPPLVNGPWENEIDCVETDGKFSNVWRFGHTYSSARNGFWSQPHGNVSRDGRFFVFTSDWQDQLGHDLKANRYRTDIFVMELR